MTALSRALLVLSVLLALPLVLDLPDVWPCDDHLSVPDIVIVSQLCILVGLLLWVLGGRR